MKRSPEFGPRPAERLEVEYEHNPIKTISGRWVGIIDWDLFKVRLLEHATSLRSAPFNAAVVWERAGDDCHVRMDIRTRKHELYGLAEGGELRARELGALQALTTGGWEYDQNSDR